MDFLKHFGTHPKNVYMGVRINANFEDPGLGFTLYGYEKLISLKDIRWQIRSLKSQMARETIKKQALKMIPRPAFLTYKSTF